MKKLLQHDVIQKRVLFTAWHQTSRCKLKREKSVLMLQLFVKFRFDLIYTKSFFEFKINWVAGRIQNTKARREVFVLT